MQEKRLGNIYGFTGGSYAGLVYDKSFLAPSLNAMQGGNRQPMIIVAMRGRNPENPTSRVAGLPTEQRLEPNLKGVSNTLTSVQKDNLVLEPMAYDEQNGYIRDDGTVGTLTTDGSSPKHNNRVIENLSPKLIGGIGEINFGKQYRQGNRVYDAEGVGMALTAQPLGNTGGNSYMYLIKEPQYRIRKLTPKECWRLMGFTDDDFHKAEAVNSNTQLYKQAGNSIVKDVLMAIFKQMLPYEERQIEGVGKQLMVDMAVEEDRQKMPF